MSEEIRTYYMVDSATCSYGSYDCIEDAIEQAERLDGNVKTITEVTETRKIVWEKPNYEIIKLGIDIGDEVVDNNGAKGVVVGIDTYNDEVLLSLLMRNHKVPQLVEASLYKTKTGRHFPQIVEVLEQMKGEADGK